MKIILRHGCRCFYLSLLILFVFAAEAAAQSSGGSFTLTSHVVAGGGCAPDGSGGCTQSIGSGNLSVDGTVAEPGAIELVRQPPYSLRGGFWYGTEVATPTATNGKVIGRIVDSNGNPVAGAVVRIVGTQNRLTITSADGTYSFSNVETNGFYTVTPARANYTFNPFNRSFSQVGNQTEAQFTGTPTSDNLNPLDTAEYFVRQQYVDVLGREPDEAGFNFWSDQFLVCRNDADCIRSRRIAVAAEFFVHQEFQQSGAFIYNFYEAALSRWPAYAEYAVDRRQVLGGRELEAEKQAFAESFVRRPQFITRYQSNTTAESFVDALLAGAPVNGSGLGGQRSGLISTYNLGASMELSRVLVLRAIADHAGFKQSQYNGAFVLTEYFSYLRRDPDRAGYDFWLNLLNNSEKPDSSNYHGMVCSFITSAEYQNRFSSAVTHSNGECTR